ncbi:MAG: HPP family protein [Verrucomicrobiota bacterium]
MPEALRILWQGLLFCADVIVSLVVKGTSLRHASARIPHESVEHPLSALIGVSCARWIPVPELAAALAVGLSIGMMHQLKCIHPPGAATSLSAVLGGAAIHELGFRFVFIPVLVNCLLMIGIAVAFNMFFGWRRYPACLTRRETPTLPGTPSHEDIVMALRSLDTFVDVSEEDLVLLNRLLTSRRMSVPLE